ncbi:MAG: shikimate dehydrogenase family protein [Acutalibacter sp.]|jgi:shikimate dehydrogenase
MQALKAAVIGHPIGHTMSPFIHRRLFALEGIAHSYQVLDVPDLSAALPALRELDCFNITIPHKEAILPHLDWVEENARRFGSVNTVQVQEGRLRGWTTDGPGCRKALENHGVPLEGELLVLGNGGAARAIAFEAVGRKAGSRLTIACREGSLSKAQALARELEEYARDLGDGKFSVGTVTYGELEGESSRWDLLLNATSVGMYPHVGVSPVSGEVISRCAAVFDAVYNPAKTELLRLAEEAGAKAVGGMEMLVYQAVAAHELWFGTAFRQEDLAVLCRDAQEELIRLFPGNDTEKGGSL